MARKNENYCIVMELKVCMYSKIKKLRKTFGTCDEIVKSVLDDERKKLQ
jgi:hypothetical protein